MSDMGLAGELALIAKAIALSTRALKELQTSESVFLVFVFIIPCFFPNATIIPADSAFY
jgi:hypothetical protein